MKQVIEIKEENDGWIERINDVLNFLSKSCNVIEVKFHSYRYGRFCTIVYESVAIESPNDESWRTFVFTTSRDVIEALIKVHESLGPKGFKILGHSHDVGFSTAKIELTGELGSLIFTGIYIASHIKINK